MSTYGGSEPCSGCGMSGVVKPRRSKNELCDDCQRQLELGRSLDMHMPKDEFKNFREFVNCVIPENIFATKEVRLALFAFFRALTCPKERASGWFILVNSEYNVMDRRVVLPKATVDAAKRLCTALKENFEAQMNDKKTIAELMKARK